MTTSADVLSLLADLIRINSVNPNYDGGVPEEEIACFVEAYFRDRGVEVTRTDVYPQRPNVIARLPGRDSSRRIILEAHLDTVSVKGMTIDPWDPLISNDRMHGRGACDTKGGMAAMMTAVALLAEEGFTPACDVWFAAVIDEEFSYRGVAALCRDLTADAAIVAEPTSLLPVVASKGLVRWKIETRGKSAHSAKPQLGVNAIDQMAHLVNAIAEDTRKLAAAPHPLLGPATCNVGTIRGGVQVNLVPADCVIELDRRLLPHESVEQVLEHYQQLVDRVAADHPDMDVVMHPPMLTDVPLETDVNSSTVRTITKVLADLGLDATPIGVPFCSDASKFGAIEIPSIILGPGSIDQAHAADEFIECEQVQQAVQIYRQFIVQFD